MSIGPTSLAGNVAASQLTQARGSELDRNREETAQEVAKAEATKAAATDGSIHANSETDDRDGDGRDVGRGFTEDSPEDDVNETEAAQDDPPHSLDPTGDCGKNIDLSG